MTISSDPDPVIRQFLAVGDDALPGPSYDAVRARLGRTPQRAVVGRWPLPASFGPARLTTAAVVGVAAVLAISILPGGGARAVGEVRFAAGWPTGPQVAFVATLPPGAPAGLYWRGATYDVFQLSGWVQTRTASQQVAPGRVLPVGSGEMKASGTADQITVSITPGVAGSDLLLAPGIPLVVDRATQVVTTGADGWLGQVELGAGEGPYRVTASIPRLDDAKVVTAQGLAAASTDDPQDIRAVYTGIPDGAIGPQAAALLRTVIAQAGSMNRYRLAAAMQAYLRGPAFRYSFDLSGVECTSPSAVECFASTRTGYCLHFASTMAILLRAANPGDPIPTRLVQGFLPGDRTGGIETVRVVQAHAWVEVYFPGYGWIPFDPTPTGTPAVIPAPPADPAPSIPGP